MADLNAATQALGLGSPAQEEWFALVEHKLLAQLELPPLLVAAVVGGTNIGKSVLFNHLAGETASAASPLAAGTKHPVCLAPASLDGHATLAKIFEGFELRRWQSPNDPLVECQEHLLFWRSGAAVPERLLLLDTPDVDSDAQVNWRRAEQIRHTSDVLIAVLTQQKYNDAAVKQFFRKAAEADKPVIVIFNQCDLEADRDYWPRWLATFTDETGVRPHQVYVVPYDRAGAGGLRLPFYAVGPDGRAPLGEPSSLGHELGRLHFDAIKLRTFRGAMTRVLGAAEGAPQYLDRVRRAGREFAAAARALSAGEMARVNWPTLPAPLLVAEIQQWWDGRRSRWSRQVHGLYRTLGQGVTWPIRRAWQATRPHERSPQETFHAREHEAIVEAIAKLFDELDRLARVGNEILRPRLAALLGGGPRQQLLQRVAAAHAALPAFDDHYRRDLRAELDRWCDANPRADLLLRSLDHAAAVARPAVTVALAVSGWIFAGDVVGQAAAHVAGHTAGHLTAEAVIAGGVAGGGEAVVSATGEGMKQAAARLFGRLQAHYAELRARWLAEWLERELLGDLLAELQRGAAVAESPAFREAEHALAALATMRT